jgi:hypothetical protein
MTYAELVNWIIRQDDSVQRLWYWASQTVKMFWYPEHFTVERILERLGGLHISSENDDYSFHDTFSNMPTEYHTALMKLALSGASYSHALMTKQANTIVNSMYFDTDVQYGSECFIGFVCLFELYKAAKDAV